MATQEQVLDVHRQNPLWNSPQIARALGCSAGYVRRTLSRNGCKLASTRKPGRQLQDWERQSILDAYKDGEKLEAVAAEFGVTRYCVSVAAQRAGFPRRKRKERK